MNSTGIKQLSKPGLKLIVLSLLFLGAKSGLSPHAFPEMKFFPEMPLPIHYTITEEGISLGRQLFYDPILSSDSTLSCSSCHQQKYAFSDAPNKFSKGKNSVFMTRNTLPLFNLAWYPSFFWDGKATGIENQVFHPITASDEMNMHPEDLCSRLNENKYYKSLFQEIFGAGEIDSEKVSIVLAQFLRSLLSNQSKYDRVIAGKDHFTENEIKGFVLVNDQTKGDCLHCHPTDGDALGTTLTFSNNGLDSVVDVQFYPDKGRGGISEKKEDIGKFKIPSLRNLLFTAPYMHDGRFKTLEEVLEFYSSGVKNCVNLDSKMQFANKHGANLSKEEQQSIIAFLKTLSDSVFISDKNFSNPFKKLSRN